MNRQDGFTMVEVMVVFVLLVPTLGLILTCTETASRNLAIDDTVAKTMETLQRSAVRISQIARPCAMTSYRMQATAADVAAALATTVGEWIEPVDGQPRTAIRFRSATGTVSMNASALTSPRTFRFVMDPRETDNDVDDDGDGMVDEGKVIMDYDGNRIAMAGNVESCTFTLTNRLLRIELRAAARRRDGSIQRFTARETLFLRNN